MGDADIFDLTHRLPTCEEIQSAADAATFLANARNAAGALVVPRKDGETVQLSPAICNLFVDVLGHIARGDMVTVIPTGALLTTQQAADILNVSRPHLSKLLKEEKIPHIPVGSHRRVKHSDLMAFKSQRDGNQMDALDDLARLGQEFDNS